MIENVAGITADTVVTFTKEVTQQDINTFADVTGDHNPLHSNEEYAARTRFKRPIAHGMFGAGVISAALGTRLAPESVVVYLGQNLRFRAPVLAGDTITATCTV
ncbi:MAG TPA: MaoC family dehydratase, partial [Dehalococcoidia bacterium]|nr:MaoC family dehydratase [Dehalococcoidia bacterium]